MRGWRWHWRRGIIGTIQGWAEGRRHRVIHILAEMAQYFGVEAEVGVLYQPYYCINALLHTGPMMRSNVHTSVASYMGFGLTKQEVADMKVDTYIVERVRDALKHLK